MGKLADSESEDALQALRFAEGDAKRVARVGEVPGVVIAGRNFRRDVGEEWVLLRDCSLGALRYGGRACGARSAARTDLALNLDACAFDKRLVKNAFNDVISNTQIVNNDIRNPNTGIRLAGGNTTTCASRVSAVTIENDTFVKDAPFGSEPVSEIELSSISVPSIVPFSAFPSMVTPW